MNRRLFLRNLLGASPALVAPSLVWPFRKIFLPVVGPATWISDEWTKYFEPPGPFGVEVSREELTRTLGEFKSGIGYLAIDEPPSPHWLNLKRSIYPGPLHGTVNGAELLRRAGILS